MLWTKGITLSQACAVTLVFEGMAAEVEVQQRTVASLVLESKGVWGGASASHRGYQMTFAIAYIRDFLLDFRVLAESFETFAPWSVLSDIWPAVTSAVQAEHVALGLPGQPCLTVRLTQLYHQGGVLYMYLAACMGSLGPAEALEAYHRLEEAARRAILHVGGSLSHHHGVGKIRSSHLEATQSPAFLAGGTLSEDCVGPSKLVRCPEWCVGARCSPARCVGDQCSRENRGVLMRISFFCPCDLLHSFDEFLLLQDLTTSVQGRGTRSTFGPFVQDMYSMSSPPLDREIGACLSCGLAIATTGQ